MSISRSSLYYRERPIYRTKDQMILRAMDEIYTEYPFYGHRRVRDELLDLGFTIGKDRVLKYMKVLGLEPIYPKKLTSIRNIEHKIYPYLLRDREISRVNEVWADNVIVERFFRTIKYENIYIRDYNNILEVRKGVKNYLEFYNNKRRHSSLNKLRPSEVYNFEQQKAA